MAEGEHAELKALKETLRLSHPAIAKRLGVSVDQWKGWYYQKAKVPPDYIKKTRALALTDPAPDVYKPEGAASELEVDVPYVGRLAASSKVDWTDPLEGDLTREIPVKWMLELKRGVFTAQIGGDSMSPFLEPDDLAVFKAADSARIGLVVYYRHKDGRVTVKQLRHDGVRPILHALNPNTDDEPADGQVIGILTGWRRRKGRREQTDFDPDGLTPDFF